jgi:hypothetical protein
LRDITKKVTRYYILLLTNDTTGVANASDVCPNTPTTDET